MSNVRPQNEMPVYRFQISSPLTVQSVLERVQAVTREPPGFWQSVKESFKGGRTGVIPFIGGVQGSSFRVRRDIHYRNSFLPQVVGRVKATASGTVVFVTMHLHPAVVVFMVLWLGGVGVSVLVILASGHGVIAPALVPLGMFVFGIALTAVGFYPEAFKARRLLEQSIAGA